MIHRLIEARILSDLSYFPVIGVIGPRQVGKTTLVKMIQSQLTQPFHYLDLELASDLRKLNDSESYLKLFSDSCVIIDEVQRMPSLFPLLRALVDMDRRPARFIILGSASPGLIREASETLAGRIAYSELAPFSFSEIQPEISLLHHWLAGGFPDAVLAPELSLSWRWLENFARTFIERDLRELGHEISSPFLRKFLSMLSHIHGQLLNVSELSRSLGISQPTVKRYLDLLEGGFIIHRLLPFYVNTKKRLVKSPKVYIRDSGLLHYLSNIRTGEQLYGHILVGASWEGYVIEQIKREVGSDWQLFFYRTHGGAEIDLILVSPSGKTFCLEIKYSNSPSLSKGFFQGVEEIKPDMACVITPQSDSYPLKGEIWVHSLPTFLSKVLPKES